MRSGCLKPPCSDKNPRVFEKPARDGKLPNAIWQASVAVSPPYTAAVVFLRRPPPNIKKTFPNADVSIRPAYAESPAVGVKPVADYLLQAQQLVVGAVQYHALQLLHKRLGRIVGGLEQKQNYRIAVYPHVGLFLLASLREPVRQMPEYLAAVKAVSNELVGAADYVSRLFRAEPFLPLGNNDPKCSAASAKSSLLFIPLSLPLAVSADFFYCQFFHIFAIFSFLFRIYSITFKHNRCLIKKD